MSLLGSLAGLASTIYNATVGERHRKEDKQFAHNEAELASQRQMEMQNKLLAYNDPSAQMSRMQGAGLNPDLMYGQMSSQVPVAGSGSQASTPSTPVQYVDPALLSQMRLNNAQAEAIEHDTARKDEMQPYEVQQLQSVIENLNKDIEVKSAQIQSMSVDDQLKLAEKAHIAFQEKMDEKQFVLHSKEVVANIDHLKKQGKLINSQVNLNQQTYKEMVQTAALRAAGIDLQNELIRKQIGLTQAQIDEADKNLQLLGFKVEAGNVDYQTNVRQNAAMANSAVYREYRQMLSDIKTFTNSIDFGFLKLK